MQNTITINIFKYFYFQSQKLTIYRNNTALCIFQPNGINITFETFALQENIFLTLRIHYKMFTESNPLVTRRTEVVTIFYNNTDTFSLEKQFLVSQVNCKTPDHDSTLSVPYLQFSLPFKRESSVAPQSFPLCALQSRHPEQLHEATQEPQGLPTDGLIVVNKVRRQIGAQRFL